MLNNFYTNLIKWDLVFYKIINKDLGNQYVFILFSSITNLLDLITLGLVIFTLYSIVSKRSIPLNKKLFLIIVPVLLTATINVILKLIFHRIGPTPLGLQPWPEFSLMHINYAFPSGHTSRAFALATSLSHFYPKHKRLFFIAAMLIGFSRIYIGAHYPLDVLGGAIVGIAIPIIFYKQIKK